LVLSASDTKRTPLHRGLLRNLRGLLFGLPVVVRPRSCLVLMGTGILCATNADSVSQKRIIAHTILLKLRLSAMILNKHFIGESH